MSQAYERNNNCNGSSKTETEEKDIIDKPKTQVGSRHKSHTWHKYKSSKE